MRTLQRTDRGVSRTRSAAAVWCLVWLLAAMPAPAADRAEAGASSRPTSQPAPAIEVDRKARRVSIPARAARQGIYPQLKGAIEYLLVSTGGKEYETVFVTPCTAEAIRDAMEAIGLSAGTPAGESAGPKGKPVRIFVEYLLKGKPVRRAADEFVLHAATGKPLPPADWTYTGSTMLPDPGTHKDVLQAGATRNLVGLHFTDASPLVQNSRAEAAKENLYRTNVRDLPAPTAALRIVFERPAVQARPGERRVHVFVRGRVQGVGFRNFVERAAKVAKVHGFVRNLADGRVEAVFEGPAAGVADVLSKVKTGPRAARVEGVDLAEETAEDEFDQFQIRY